MFKKALDVFVCVCHLFECVQKLNVFKKERVMGTAFQNDPLEDVSVEEESAVVEQVKEGAEEGRDKNLARKWSLAFFFVGLGIVTSVYSLILGRGLEQTSALFIGIPTILAAFLSFTPKSKSMTGMLLKSVTFCLLAFAIVLPEGMVCLLMAAPLFWFVAAVFGGFLDFFEHLKKGNRTVNVMILLPLFALMSTEGVWDATSFSRDERVVVEQVVPYKVGEVRKAFARPMELSKELPAFFRLGFPRAMRTSGSGLQVGAKRVILFGGGEGAPGELTLRVVSSDKGGVRFVKESDKSHIAHWLHWKDMSITWKAHPKGTKIRWVQRYTRMLDPAWYFGPLERYAVKEMVQFLIRETMVPKKPGLSRRLARREKVQ
jgi:hypothetical protein